MKKSVGWVIGGLLFLGGLTNCRRAETNNDYLVSFNDTIKNGYGYKNQNGEVVIAPGKYPMCFTDTFRTFAVVAKAGKGFWAIDRGEHVLYEVFPFDNGPDEPAEGLFRIIVNHKIGYADAITGKIKLPPRFSCAQPFAKGMAEVSESCTTKVIGEHTAWLSNNWYFIDRQGRKVTNPVTEKKE
jgi:hypothetical protein